MPNQLDKSQWAKGVWDDEPDMLEGIDDDTGYPVQIIRNFMGALCGYLVIPKSHPYFNSHEYGVDVHGGITYEEELFKQDDIMIGFDCNHVGDASPYMIGMKHTSPSDIYRDIAYVKAQVASLAKQFKSMEK